MMDLSSSYMGLSLKSPIIVGSCGLTNSVRQVEQYAQAGAGAVVLKSLFEEQIAFELQKNITDYTSDYPEAYDYIREYTRGNGIERYLDHIHECKRRVDIPVIASVNCVSSKEWIRFAKSAADAGADGLEVNVSMLPADLNLRGSDYEKVYFEVIEKIAEHVKIPVALKMSQYSLALANLISRLSWTGKVQGFVLFNRYYRPDFNIETMQVETGPVYSTKEEISSPLRWVALLSGRINTDFCASTGVHDGAGLVKLLLAGAAAVQMVSALYEHSAQHIETTLTELKEWMTRHNYSSLNEFRGKMAWNDTKAVNMQRVQFMKHFSSIE